MPEVKICFIDVGVLFCSCLFILLLGLLFAVTGFVPSYPPFPLNFTFSHLFFNAHTPFSPLTFVVVCLYRCHDFVLWFVFRSCFLFVYLSSFHCKFPAVFLTPHPTPTPPASLASSACFTITSVFPPNPTQPFWKYVSFLFCLLFVTTEF